MEATAERPRRSGEEGRMTLDAAKQEPGRNGVVNAVRRGAVAMFALALRWRERAVQRRDLAALTDDQLRDVGLTRHQARREAAKPFWRS
jgi:uncharacterized protein YjiS (DUF1127 family)